MNRTLPGGDAGFIPATAKMTSETIYGSNRRKAKKDVKGQAEEGNKVSTVALDLDLPTCAELTHYRCGWFVCLGEEGWEEARQPQTSKATGFGGDAEEGQGAGPTARH